MWKAEPAPPSEPPPLTILAAMGIALGGALLSAASDYWLLAQNPGWIAFLSPLFLVFNLGLVALNIWFLVGMWHQEEWALRAAFAMVVMGAAFDCFSVIYPYLLFGDFGFLYFLWLAASKADWMANVILTWSWVHLVVIQAPILVLLWLTPSRQWVGIETPIDRLRDRVSRS